MIKFILNNQLIETELPKGATVLDFARYHKNLKGTKIGCREGDCGACTIMVGELNGENLKYRTQTSCLMPLANANGKHIVTVEGINKQGDELTEVQNAMVENSGTQCGFCTVGFVMSLTNFCIDDTPKTIDSAISAIDGNICRCTGYKSIERAAASLTEVLNQKNGQTRIDFAIEKGIVPDSFAGIKERLEDLRNKPMKILQKLKHTRKNSACRTKATAVIRKRLSKLENLSSAAELICMCRIPKKWFTLLKRKIFSTTAH